jgi:hypothetical protein
MRRLIADLGLGLAALAIGPVLADSDVHRTGTPRLNAVPQSQGGEQRRVTPSRGVPHVLRTTTAELPGIGVSPMRRASPLRSNQHGSEVPVPGD